MMIMSCRRCSNEPLYSSADLVSNDQIRPKIRCLLWQLLLQQQSIIHDDHYFNQLMTQDQSLDDANIRYSQRLRSMNRFFGCREVCMLLAC